MRHQVKVGTATVSGNSVILSRPELAALIGCVISEASLLESSIIHLYGQMMSGSYLPRPKAGVMGAHPVALQVFDVVENNRIRLELLQKLAKWVIKDESLLQRLESEIILSIRKAMKQRNEIAHSQWGVSPDYPDALIAIPIFGHQMAYKQADFEEALSLLHDAEARVTQFAFDLRKHFEDTRAEHGFTQMLNTELF